MKPGRTLSVPANKVAPGSLREQVRAYYYQWAQNKEVYKAFTATFAATLFFNEPLKARKNS